MDKPLIEYLRRLPDEAARQDFARRVGTSVGHLRNVGHGWKPCSHKLAALIWVESRGEIGREVLCPSDYWIVWPDLKAPTKAGRGRGMCAVPATEAEGVRCAA